MNTQRIIVDREAHEAIAPRETIKTEKEVNLKLLKGKGRKNKAGTLVWVLLVFAVFFTIITRYSHMTKLNYEIADLKSQLNEKNAVNSALMLELDKKTNLMEVRYEAQRGLGMSEPDKNQVIYIEVPRANSVFVVGKSKDKEEKPVGIIDSIKGYITGSL